MSRPIRHSESAEEMPAGREHRATQAFYTAEGQTPKVRLSMTLVDAQALAELLTLQRAGPGRQRILDQLWLRTALIEQWRRTRVAERSAFQERADRTLSALDP
jgi:hypothetical protein